MARRKNQWESENQYLMTWLERCRWKVGFSSRMKCKGEAYCLVALSLLKCKYQNPYLSTTSSATLSPSHWLNIRIRIRICFSLLEWELSLCGVRSVLYWCVKSRVSRAIDKLKKPCIYKTIPTNPQTQSQSHFPNYYSMVV